jgi:structural maintenance of chromosome 3 (chondroitin sulfate proteoglycan 6)
MDAITLDGDLCSRKGALTGGYVDVTKSRLRAHAQWQQAQRTLQQVERDSRDATRKAQQVDQAVTNIMSEVQRLEAKQADMQRLVRDMEQNVQKLEERLEQHQRQMTKVEKTNVPALEVEIAIVRGDIQRVQQELGTELVSDLTEEERANLQRLKKVYNDLGAHIESQTERVAELSVERQKLQSLLEDNLLLRQKELTQVEPTTTGTSVARQEELEDKQRELDAAMRLQEEVEAKLQEARRVDDEVRGEMVASKNEVERLKSLDMKNAKALEEAQDLTERLLNKVREIEV